MLFEFLAQVLVDFFFYWSLSDCKSPQVSWTLPSIRADLHNTVVWVASTRPVIFKSSSPFINPLVTAPSSPITTGITVTFMFQSVFQFSCKVYVLKFLFGIFQFYSSGQLPSWLGSRIHRLLPYREVRPRPTNVQDMTLNNLMVRFQ